MKQFSEAMNIPGESWQPFENQNFGLYIGFKAVHKSGYTFAFKLMPEFTDTTIGGNPAATNNPYNYQNTLLGFPVGMTKNQNGSPTFMFGYEWKQLGGYSRRALFGQFAGVGTNTYMNLPATSANDTVQAGLVAEIAFHGACPNLGFLQRPA